MPKEKEQRATPSAADTTSSSTRSMVDTHTRRGFLQSAFGLGLSSSLLPVLDGGQAGAIEQGQPLQASGGRLTGRLVKPDGTTVDGTVQVYDAENDTLLFRTETGPQGRFGFTESQVQRITNIERVNVLLIGERWFGGYTNLLSDSISENDGTDWKVNNELLYGPQIARTEGNEPLGQLSVWRQVGFPDPQKQVLSVEVTNTSRTEPEPSNIAGGAYDLTSGIFTLSFNEDTVKLDYGSVTDIDFARAFQINTVDTPFNTQLIGFGEPPDLEPVGTYHPNKTGIPMAGPTGVKYTKLMTTEEEQTINEGAGRIVGNLPGISNVLTWADTLEWAFGDPLSTSASLGRDDPPAVNPNEMDTATLPWQSDDTVYHEASVVGHFPLVVEESTTVDVRAEWEFEPWTAGFGTGHGTFTERFQIGPYGDDGGEPPTATPTALVDGFEDGTTRAWTRVANPRSTFEARRERTFSGSWAAQLEQGPNDENPIWERTGETVRPTTIETAHALENGEFYADSWTEWHLGDTRVLRVNYNWSNNFAAVNGSGANPSDIDQGAVVADLPWSSSNQFFHVVLDNIDWDSSVVGEVRVNGRSQARDVPFFNDAAGIDRTTVKIGGNSGNIVFVDETTVPPEEG